MKLNLGAIFGTTFFSVIAALIIYDMVVKGLLANLNIGKYDNTFQGVDNFNESEETKLVTDGKKVYRIRKSA